MLKDRNTHARSFKRWFIGSIVIVSLVATAAFLYMHHGNNNALKQQGYTKSSTKSGSSTDTTIPGSTSSQGGAIDQNGKSPGPTSSGTPVVSSSGLITVTSPTNNASLTNGDRITGTSSTLNAVQFRLIDDQSGVIAQGSLNVTSGNFAGVLSFKHQSPSGRLDVFSYDDNGAETNEVQIPIVFK